MRLLLNSPSVRLPLCLTRRAITSHARCRIHCDVQIFSRCGPLELPFFSHFVWPLARWIHNSFYRTPVQVAQRFQGLVQFAKLTW